MKVRFQADADLNQVIVKATLRRERTIDFQSAHVANLVGLPDDQVLAICARQQRILVTHDRKTMPGHFSEFIENKSSSGVIVISQRFIVNSIVDDIILIWLASNPDEWINRFESLPL